MLTLRCTQRLLTRMRAPRVVDAPASTGVLGDWYANVEHVGRAQVIIAVSERGLLPVVFAAAPIGTMVERLREEAAAQLEAVGVPADAIRRELEAMREVTLAKTASRQILGVMNQIAFELPAIPPSARALRQLSLGLAHVPRTPLDPTHVFSDVATRALFEAPARAANVARTARAADRADTANAVPHVRLTVTLRDARPAIWRRLVVPRDLPLRSLHHVLQRAFGWQESHLHQFDIDGAAYGRPDGMGPDFEDDRHVRLGDVAPPGGSFVYEYDFGDSWLHDVLVEGVEETDPRGLSCIAGERRGPPEDAGGVFGYEDMLRILGKPRHPEHRSVRAWLGPGFSAEAFDRDAVNRSLAVLERTWRGRASVRAQRSRRS